MSYPPPGGYDPQQYHVSGQPSQPNDPYSQGYNAPPPQPGYGQDPNQYPPQPGYGQDPNQYPPQPGYGQDPNQYPPPPNATPPVGVQPGYQQGGSPLPPPIPPSSQGSNLGIILGVIVALVVVLGVAAVLIVPGMLEDDGGTVEASDNSSSSAPAEDESPSPEGEESPSPEASASDDTEGTGGGSYDWSTPVSSDDFDPNTPKGAAITWEIAVDDGDMDALAELMCSSPTEDLQWDYEWEVENNTAPNYDFLIWAVAKEPQGGEVEVWAGWTLLDTPPESQQDLDEGGGQYYTVVEEDGTWKVCDIAY